METTVFRARARIPTPERLRFFYLWWDFISSVECYFYGVERFSIRVLRGLSSTLLLFEFNPLKRF